MQYDWKGWANDSQPAELLSACECQRRQCNQRHYKSGSNIFFPQTSYVTEVGTINCLFMDEI